MVEWLYFVEERVTQMEGGDREDQVLHLAHKGKIPFFFFQKSFRHKCLTDLTRL